MERLESGVPRPGEARYQPALRPDLSRVLILPHF